MILSSLSQIPVAVWLCWKEQREEKGFAVWLPHLFRQIQTLLFFSSCPTAWQAPTICKQPVVMPLLTSSSVLL